MGALGAPPEHILDALGALLGTLGALLGTLGRPGGRSWTLLGRSWAPLKCVLQKSMGAINFLRPNLDPKMEPSWSQNLLKNDAKKQCDFRHDFFTVFLHVSIMFGTQKSMKF